MSSRIYELQSGCSCWYTAGNLLTRRRVGLDSNPLPSSPRHHLSFKLARLTIEIELIPI